MSMEKTRKTKVRAVESFMVAQQYAAASLFVVRLPRTQVWAVALPSDKHAVMRNEVDMPLSIVGSPEMPKRAPLHGTLIELVYIKRA